MITRREATRSWTQPSPKLGGSEKDCGQVVSGGLLVAGGGAAEVLKLVEQKALDEVALPKGFMIDRALDLTIVAGRYVRPPAATVDQVDDGAGVVAAIGDGVAAGRPGFEQGWAVALLGA